jgi:hypothetical protein
MEWKGKSGNLTTTRAIGADAQDHCASVSAPCGQFDRSDSADEGRGSVVDTVGREGKTKRTNFAPEFVFTVWETHELVKTDPDSERHLPIGVDSMGGTF